MMRRILRQLPLLVLIVLAWGCFDSRNGALTPTQATAKSVQPGARLYYVRSRAGEVSHLTPEARITREREATRALLARMRTADDREALDVLLDPVATARIYAVPGDSVAAELVSLIYSLQDVERRERKSAGRW